MRRDSVGKMKTLDEVIESIIKQSGLEIRNVRKPDRDRFWVDRETYNDALHYLKEYKNTDENYKKAIAHVIEVIDHYEKMVADYLAVNNPPLTWDELRQMEGKPVWVESSDSFNRRRWMFVGEWFDDDEMRLFDIGNDYPDYVSKNGYESGTWQAYRKERK